MEITISEKLLKVYALCYERDLEEVLHEAMNLTKDQIDYLQTHMLTVTSLGSVVPNVNASFETNLKKFKDRLRSNKVGTYGHISKQTEYAVIAYTSDFKEEFAKLMNEIDEFDTIRLADAISNYYETSSEFRMKLENIFKEGLAESLYYEFD